MSDFFQNGVITTIHRLGRETLETLEARLQAYRNVNRVALVIPCLISELEGPAIGPIVRELAKVEYIEEIVVPIGRADRRQFEGARRFFAPLGARGRLLWLDGAKMQSFTRELSENGLETGPQGKGRATWFSLGYVLARGRSTVIALHDADIVTYDRWIPARLCYPLVDPNLGYEYSKGYYSRATDRLHGRVTRLFVTPLVRALAMLAGPLPFLEYMDSFRYPLAGEFAMQADLARSVHIPGDWGLEIGMLAEVYRNSSLRRVCQVDVADVYDHKHQILSEDDASAGLHRMARDIAKAMLRTLAMEGVVFGDGFFTSLQVAYVRRAQEAVRSYHDDAIVNSLRFDRHSETRTVEVFTQALSTACGEFRSDPFGAMALPNWNRVTAAIPDFLRRYQEAIDSENLS
ncbi:MAG TPA: glycosyl transferase [Acidobacteriota bacterium]|nr:glycosyl transferase [Acidobacteriota bacterium]